MDLTGKTVIITGASSGIGKAVARLLSGKGMNLVLLARREKELNELAEELKGSSEILVVKSDVTIREQVQYAVNKVSERFGKIDLLINNAGLGYFGPTTEINPEDLDQVIKTNIYGLINMTQAAAPFLKQSKGMIVNISSGLSKRALPYLTVYAGTKSMVDALSDGMRLELKKYEIKVLNYCPPETDTEFHRNSRQEIALEMGERQRKFAKVEEVAARIIKAIESEKREVIEGRFLKIMNFFAPKLLDKMFYKGMVLKLGKE